MNIQEARSRKIVETVSKIRATIDGAAAIENMNKAKEYLVELAMQRELFPETDFPWPTLEQKERTYCVYRGEDGKYALYLDLVNKGVSNTPHDHGNSWAMVAAVVGKEKHHLFKRVDDGRTPGVARLERAGEIVVEPGRAVSMLVGGIHSIEAISDGPIMCLHCYERPFEDQTNRKEYDLSSGTYSYGFAVAGVIEDATLNAGAEP